MSALEVAGRSGSFSVCVVGRDFNKKAEKIQRTFNLTRAIVNCYFNALKMSAIRPDSLQPRCVGKAASSHDKLKKLSTLILKVKLATK